MISERTAAYLGLVGLLIGGVMFVVFAAPVIMKDVHRGR